MRQKITHKQQTETLAIESCCVCREGMKSKNWRVVRDFDVFKILVQLAPNVIKKKQKKKTHQYLYSKCYDRDLKTKPLSKGSYELGIQD